MFQGQDVIEAETAQTIEAQEREITRLAYQFYEDRGSAAGHALDDWLEAKLKVRQDHDDLLQFKPLKMEGSAGTEGQNSATHPAHWPTRQLVVGLIVMGAVLGGMTIVVLSPGSHKAQIVQRPSMAEQMALTAGYRAMLYNPATHGP